MSLNDTQAFFERYCDTFNRLDGDGIADLWHSPSAIADSRDGEARVTWWAEDEPMRQNMRALCAIYDGVGNARWSFDLIDQVPMGQDHAFAHVRWTLARDDGSVLQRFGTGYHVARFAEGPRVLMCTAYQEDLSELKRHVA
jgi:hypothetical protein